jgi:hypothetical protein
MKEIQVKLTLDCGDKQCNCCAFIDTTDISYGVWCSIFKKNLEQTENDYKRLPECVKAEVVK